MKLITSKNLILRASILALSVTLASCGDSENEFTELKSSLYATVYSSIDVNRKRSLVKNLKVDTLDLLLTHSSGVIISQNIAVSRDNITTDNNGVIQIDSLLGNLKYEQLQTYCSDVCLERRDTVECGLNSSGEYDCVTVEDACVVFAERCSDEIVEKQASLENIETVQVQMSYRIAGTEGVSLSDTVNPINEYDKLTKEVRGEDQVDRYYQDTMNIDVNFNTDIPFGYDGSIVTQSQALSKAGSSTTPTVAVRRIKATKNATVEEQILTLMSENKLNKNAYIKYQDGVNAIKEVFNY